MTLTPCQCYTEEEIYCNATTEPLQISPTVLEDNIFIKHLNQTWVAFAVATFTEQSVGACHSFRSSLVMELTSLTELEVTCYVGLLACQVVSMKQNEIDYIPK